MVTIRIAEGVGHGPTPLAAYDAALASIGAEQYNLVTLTSVIPAEATLVREDTLRLDGSVGDRLYAVQATATSPATQPGAAGIGWARTADGHGIFYETGATGEDPTGTVEAELSLGLDAGLDLRDWAATERDLAIAEANPSTDHGCAVVLAAYGQPDGW